MDLYNSSNIIGQVMTAATVNFTGSLDLTLFLVFFCFMMVFLVFKVPLQFTVLMLTPIIIVMAAYSGVGLALLGCAILIIAGVVAKLVYD